MRPNTADQHHRLPRPGCGQLEIIAVHVDATQSTLQAHGELDLATVDLLAAALDDELKHGHRFVRLDLSRLTFMDCAGLVVFVKAHNRFLTARGTLVLTGARPQVMRMLAITRLDEALFLADGATNPPRPRHLASVSGPKSDTDESTDSTHAADNSAPGLSD